MATECSTRRKRSMATISRSSSRISVRSSTRMKKVAAPPPPPLKSSVSSNGKGSHDTPMTTTPGEDCAIDELLEGRMDLDVVLPDCSKIRMTVDRRMAMMDLLVHVATANKISAGNHIINIGSKDESSVHYKPNTSIGSLDTNTVYIIPKPVTDLPIRKMPKLGNQPFEQTFRLQVNLPSNQRMVLRVSPHRTLAEVKQQICAEKELNYSTHHLVHPSHPESVLDLNSTLEIYGYAEISLMSNSSLRDSIRSTSTNFIAYQRPEEEKRRKGILGLFSRKKKGMSLDASSNGVNSRGVSPARSEVSVRSSYQPKQSTKRKPAPAPPPAPPGPSPSPPLVIQCSKVVESHTESEVSVKADEIGSTVSHSRHSSDSSGYHEPSVFSDCSENKSPDASLVHGNQALTAPESPRPKDNQEIHIHKKKSSTPIKETTNLNSVASYSSVSVSSTLRKRKAPQPPVPPPLPEAPKESPTSETTSPFIEVAAICPSESIEVFQKSPPAEEVNSGLQSVSNETVAKHQTEEANDTAACNATIPASPNPVSAATQPCSSSCSEASVIPKDSKNKSAVAYEADSVSGQASSPLVEPHDALPSYQNSEEIDAAYTESCSSKEFDDISQENANAQHPIEENIEEEAAGMGQQVTQCDDETDLKSLTTTPHSEVEATMAVLDVVINEQLQSNEQSANAYSPVKSDLLESEENGDLVDKAEETEASSSDTHEVPMLDGSQVLKKTDTECVDQNSHSVMDEIHSVQVTEDAFSNENKPTSPSGHTKLPNFTLGCYQTINKDIYDSDNSGKLSADIQQVKEYNDLSQNAIKRSDMAVDKTDPTVEIENLRKPEMPHVQKRKTLDVKITSLKEHEKENSDHFITKGQVQEKRAQFVGLGTQSLGGRSASLHNLTPKKRVVREIMSSEEDAESSGGGLYRTQSDQNVVQENAEFDEKQISFLQEQKRLYEEYQKLQAQFISWQKQLMNNQSLLQNEQIMPKIVFPTFDGIENNLYVGKTDKIASTFTHSEASSRSDMEELKTQSLPRPKPRPFSLKEDSPVQSVSLTQKLSSSPEAPHMAKSEISPKSSESKRTSIEDISCKPTECGFLKSPNGIVPEDNLSQDVIYEEVKSQTLPRPKPKPQVTSAFVESRTMTLNRHTRPKSQVVSVIIGSWQQRNEPVTDIDSSNVASVRSKFQSLENIPHVSSKTAVSIPQEPIKASTSAVPEKKSPASKPVFSDKGVDANCKVVQAVDKEKHSKHIQKSDASKHLPKTDKVSKSETLSQSRYPKPLIRLTSMKDDFHLPSLRTCNKWPLGETSLKESIGSDPLRDELRTSAKAPSGMVREKIHRAEVDLRHHSKKDHKIPSEPHSKHKEVDLRRVSSKSEPGWTQKKYKESDLRQSKSETIPSDSKSTENCSKSESLPRSEPSASQVSNKGAPAVRPTKLHITTVSIHNSENAQGTTPPEVKSPRTPKLAYGALKYEGTESKLRTMAELKSVLAQKTAKKEEANRKMQVEDPKASNIPVNSSVPPPPPTSSMPVIPPAASVPISSQLVMGKQTKNTATVKQESTSQPKVQELKDPREELMLEIRGFGGRQALRKVPVAEASWHLKVFGPATHSLNSS